MARPCLHVCLTRPQVGQVLRALDKGSFFGIPEGTVLRFKVTGSSDIDLDSDSNVVRVLQLDDQAGILVFCITKEVHVIPLTSPLPNKIDMPHGFYYETEDSTSFKLRAHIFNEHSTLLQYRAVWALLPARVEMLRFCKARGTSFTAFYAIASNAPRRPRCSSTTNSGALCKGSANITGKCGTHSSDEEVALAINDFNVSTEILGTISTARRYGLGDRDDPPFGEHPFCCMPVLLSPSTGLVKLCRAATSSAASIPEADKWMYPGLIKPGGTLLFCTAHIREVTQCATRAAMPSRYIDQFNDGGSTLYYLHP